MLPESPSLLLDFMVLKSQVVCWWNQLNPSIMGSNPPFPLVKLWWSLIYIAQIHHEKPPFSYGSPMVFRWVHGKNTISATQLPISGWLKTPRGTTCQAPRAAPRPTALRVAPPPGPCRGRNGSWNDAWDAKGDHWGSNDIGKPSENHLKMVVVHGILEGLIGYIYIYMDFSSKPWENHRKMVVHGMLWDLPSW